MQQRQEKVLGLHNPSSSSAAAAVTAAAARRGGAKRQLTLSGPKVQRSLSFYNKEALKRNKAANKKMLTCDQLSDLFRRLDRNGNGTLEKAEFVDIVKKLRLNVSEDFLLGVFREVDSKTKTKGTLTLQDFIQCYQIIYYETINNPNFGTMSMYGIGSNDMDNKKQTAKEESLHAIRYGHDTPNNNFIFEVYSGNMDGGNMAITEKKVFNMEDVGKYTIESIDVDLAHLNLLMATDSRSNETSNSQIYWWIDIAMEQVQSSSVEKYIINFGLPNDGRFRSRFSQFGDPLPKESNGNFYAGNGNTSLGDNSTLSFFAQAIWMRSVPIVHNTMASSYFSGLWDKWVDPGLREGLRHYYDTRFAFMLSAFTKMPQSQQVQAYDSARSLSRRFCEASDLSIEYDDDEKDSDRNSQKCSKSKETSLRSCSSSSRSEGGEHKEVDDIFCDPSIFVPPNYRTDEATWLQETHAVRKVTSSRLVFETLGIHMIDMGGGPIATLSIRQMDDEGESERDEQELHRLEEMKKTRIRRAHLLQAAKRVTRRPTVQVESLQQDLDEEIRLKQDEEREKARGKSCRGVLGRLITGLRRKLLENLYCKGVTAYAASLADGPISLTVMLLSLVNNFSMNIMGHLESWKFKLEKEVNDLAVSKHICHANELMETVSHVKMYVDQQYSIIDHFVSEAANEQTAQSFVDEIGQDFSKTPNSGFDETATEKVKQKLSIGKMWSVLRSVRKVVDKQIRTHSVFPKGVEGADLTYDMIKSFLGKNPLSDLDSVIFGNENLELTGLEYWKKRMAMLDEDARTISQDIRESLDEKRNFYNYLLAVVTVFLGPMTILTGYWGMNFENMPELSVDRYSWFPGVKLLWATGGLLYGIFFLIAIHYRIIYSAT